MNEIWGSIVKSEYSIFQNATCANKNAVCILHECHNEYPVFFCVPDEGKRFPRWSTGTPNLCIPFETVEFWILGAILFKPGLVCDDIEYLLVVRGVDKNHKLKWITVRFWVSYITQLRYYILEDNIVWNTVFRARSSKPLILFVNKLTIPAGWIWANFNF